MTPMTDTTGTTTAAATTDTDPAVGLTRTHSAPGVVFVPVEEYAALSWTRVTV